MDGVVPGGAVQVADLVLVEGDQHLTAQHGVAQGVVVDGGHQVLGVAIVAHGRGALARLEGHPAARADVVLGVQFKVDVETGLVKVLVEVQTIGGLGDMIVGGQHCFILLLFVGWVRRGLVPPPCVTTSSDS